MQIKLDWYFGLLCTWFKKCIFWALFFKNYIKFMFKWHIIHFYAIYTTLVMMIFLWNRFLGKYRNLMYKINILIFLWNISYFRKNQLLICIISSKICLISEFIEFLIIYFHQKIGYFTNNQDIDIFPSNFSIFPKISFSVISLSSTNDIGICNMVFEQKFYAVFGKKCSKYALLRLWK